MPPYAAPFSPEYPEELSRGDFPAPVWLAGESTSTFDLIWRLNEMFALPPWAAVLAVTQSQGRGQMRRHWQSPPGNLHVSFILPEDPLLAGDCASILVGYILLKAFGKAGYDLYLKWPNDIMLANGSKVGGLLLEERGKVLVAGLGVNLISAPGDTSMRQGAASRAGALPLLPGAKSPPSAFNLWQTLVNKINLEYTNGLQGKPLPEILRQVEGHLAWRGRKVLLRDEESIIAAGILQGLSAGGGIVINNGGCREFYSGSLSLE